VAASLHTRIITPVLRTVVVAAASVATTVLCVLLFGIDKQERQLLVSMVRNRQKSSTSNTPRP